MRKVLIGGFLALGLLTPALAEEPVVVYQEEMPEGYPWVMGEGTVALDGLARSYTTYDFSIGAFDASVQFRDDYDCSGEGACKNTGKFMLSLGAYPDANPDAAGDTVFVKGVFPKLPEGSAKTREVTVIVRNVGGVEGQNLVSKGPAKLSLKRVRRGKGDEASYGTLTATVTATVCEADADEVLIEGGECHDFKASYTSKVQYDSV